MTSAGTPAADAATEIRITTLHSLRGINYWSRRPVTRMDLVVGAYDEISSAQVPGFTEQLLAAMPGLWEHHCSIGERGGFVTRLRRGTYAPHIIEHVALELQSMIGHDVGFGRTRGGDVPGEYTLVFEHRHEQVGLRAAALALEAVQRALALTLDSVATAVRELEALASTADAPPLEQQVLCGITGGGDRGTAQEAMVARLHARGMPEPMVVDVSPAFLLQQGVPYAHSAAAIILDAEPTDVPERYRDPERALRLVNTLADAVQPDGLVVCPATAWDIQEYARDRGCRVAVFSDTGPVGARDARVATMTAYVRDGGIIVDRCGDGAPAGGVDHTRAIGPQVAAALASACLPVGGTKP
jgi:hypothetical protein